MLKTLIIDTYDSTFGKGLERESVRPIFNMIFPESANNDFVFAAWWQASRNMYSNGELFNKHGHVNVRSLQTQIHVVLDDDKDGEIISFAILSHPEYIRVKDYTP